MNIFETVTAFYDNLKDNMSRKFWVIIVCLIGLVVTLVGSLFIAIGDHEKYKIVEKQENNRNNVEKKLHDEKAKEFTPMRQDIEQLKDARDEMLRKYDN